MRAIYRACRTAWADETWKNVFRNLEMVEFRQQPAWIVFESSASGIPWPLRRWNLHWFIEGIERLESQTENWGKAQQLHFEGMDACWYAVAMLGTDSDGLWERGGHDDMKSWYVRLLEKQVHWLPEILSLQPYLTHDDLRTPESKMTLNWSRGMRTHLARLGITIPPVEELYNQYEGDVVGALMDASVLVKDGDRFRLGRVVYETVDLG